MSINWIVGFLIVPLCFLVCVFALLVIAAALVRCTVLLRDIRDALLQSNEQ